MCLISNHIVISTFKDFVNVKVDALGYWDLRGSLGLLGNFPSGRMLARDVTTALVDPNDFGQEWQRLETDPSLF